MDADPAEPEVSKRSRGVAVALGFFGGIFGLHRFYVGKSQTGLAMIVTFGGFGIWWLYDMVLLAAGEFRDADDLPLRNWGVDEGRRLPGRAERRVEELEERLEGLQNQFDDLAERVDFAERMLAQQRETPRLRPG
ncbi:MAG: TM2 domain-containing protein [Gemmatimonadales bacterium]|nr:TM2 domain-containing protein [Gemmatimonadales bacterium]